LFNGPVASAVAPVWSVAVRLWVVSVLLEAEHPVVSQSGVPALVYYL
jgi:hypothetical protein